MVSVCASIRRPSTTIAASTPMNMSGSGCGGCRTRVPEIIQPKKPPPPPNISARMAKRMVRLRAERPPRVAKPRTATRISWRSSQGTEPEPNRDPVTPLRPGGR